MKILVTGAAGFIGMHVSLRLLNNGHEVVGLDNLNSYYDVTLKKDRLALLTPHPGFSFLELDIQSTETIDLITRGGFDRVIHLASQAGVRYSLEAPHTYVQTNIAGFLNILEGCRFAHVPHLVYASSSSVYGNNSKLPFDAADPADHPVSLYGATKRAGELMAHSYSHLFGIPTTGLRFFTVYGPWGRPDMAPFLFTRSILDEKPIQVFNHGNLFRDFTYIDDIVEGVVRIMDVIPEATASARETPAPSKAAAPFRVYNVGSHRPIALLTFIEELERLLGKAAIKNLVPAQAGDAQGTYADVEDFVAATGFRPATLLADGLGRFVDWYLDYCEAKNCNQLEAQARYPQQQDTQ